MKTLTHLVAFIIGFCATALVYLPTLNAQEASPAASAAGPSASTSAAQKADTEWDGISVELTSVTRGEGDTITIKFKYTNSGSKKANIGNLGQFGHENMVTHVYYIDAKNKKKYLVVKDAEDKPIASNLQYFELEAGASRSGWAKFPAPPAGVDKISVYLPGAPPFEGVTIAAP